MKKMSLSWKNPKIYIPVIMVVCTGIGIYYWYQEIYTPIQQDREVLKKELQAKKDTLRVIQALKPQLKMLKEELVAANIKLDSLKSIFPDQKEIPKLIREITAVAKASGIHTTKFNPLPDIVQEYYIENKYQISVEGGYHDLADFYAFLANFTLIINLSNMKLSANPSFKANVDLSKDNLEEIPTTIAMFEMTTFSSKR